jgi:hypothetical protein
MKLWMNIRLAIPLLILEGGCAIKKKMRSHPSGADGVVGNDEVFQNTFFRKGSFYHINASPYRARASRPSAPLNNASRLLLDVAATPPMSGGEWHAQFIHTFPRMCERIGKTG